MKKLPVKRTVGNHFCDMPAIFFRVLQLQSHRKCYIKESVQKNGYYSVNILH
jgi:hypothetical protein